MSASAIILIIVLLVSVILHELMHGLVADRMGDPTPRHQGRLTLNPIPHIDPIGSILIPALLLLSSSPLLFGWARPVPYNPANLSDKKYGDAKVAFAGPGVNILLAIVFGLIVRFGGGVFPDPFIAASAMITLVNMVLAIFNLIPVPPLDGSKILFTFLPVRFRGLQSTLEQYWPIAIGFLLIFVLFFLSPVITSLFGLLTGAPLGIAFS